MHLPSGTAADTLFFNGKNLTVDAKSSQAQALTKNVCSSLEEKLLD